MEGDRGERWVGDLRTGRKDVVIVLVKVRFFFFQAEDGIRDISV